MRGQDPASLDLRLQARPESGRLLRERIRMWLEDAGATRTETFEVLLATTEAFTNAVKHPQQPTRRLVDIEASITDHTVRVSIRDYGTWQGKETRKDGGGMGLALMEHLMDAVRVECFLNETTVTMHRRIANPDK
jgi:anti-sigma regulatory factor (Ser/Thr protein kinase)